MLNLASRAFFHTNAAGFIRCGVLAAVLFSTAAAVAEPAPELAARLAKEKEDRRACKTDICSAFAKPSGSGPITCSVIKTWLSEEIQARILRDKLTWPWGNAQCDVSLDLDRKAIEDAATKPQATLKLKKHNVACKLESKDPKEGTAYDVKLSIEPTVTFEGGKAVKADMAWGSIEAPILAKTAIWPAVTADNNLGILSSSVVGRSMTFCSRNARKLGSISLPANIFGAGVSGGDVRS